MLFKNWQIIYIIIFVSGHEKLGNMNWQNIGQELFVVSLKVLHLFFLLCKFSSLIGYRMVDEIFRTFFGIRKVSQKSLWDGKPVSIIN